MCRGLAVLLAASGAHAADLSATEHRWLQGMWPVVAHARASNHALDVVVQPQPSAGTAPLAMAFVEGRCKLVLSMRDNPEAQATLDRIEPELLDAALELMAAHELGHCRRYMEGRWYVLPAGFAAGVPEALGPDLREAWRDMQAMRLEEGYGDLVGLAWTQRHHPQLYARLHAWLLAERLREHVPRSPHDTLGWVRRAAGGFAADEASIFSAAATLWQAGLAADD